MKKPSVRKNDNDKLGLVLKEIFGLEKKMDSGFDRLRNDFRQLQKSVDNYAHRADTYFQEMVMLGRKVDRLEKWIMQVAEKVGIHLKS